MHTALDLIRTFTTQSTSRRSVIRRATGSCSIKRNPVTASATGCCDRRRSSSVAQPSDRTVTIRVARVKIEDEPSPRASISFVSPTGFWIDGLTIDQAIDHPDAERALAWTGALYEIDRRAEGEVARVGELRSAEAPSILVALQAWLLER